MTVDNRPIKNPPHYETSNLTIPNGNSVYFRYSPDRYNIVDKPALDFKLKKLNSQDSLTLASLITPKY